MAVIFVVICLFLSVVFFLIAKIESRGGRGKQRSVTSMMAAVRGKYLKMAAVRGKYFKHP